MLPIRKMDSNLCQLSRRYNRLRIGMMMMLVVMKRVMRVYSTIIRLLVDRHSTRQHRGIHICIQDVR